MAGILANRRWNRLVKDPNYGPLLGRLNKGQQKEIRELVDQNKGREARKRVTALDEERRTRVRIRSKLRRVMAKEPAQRKGTNPFAGSGHDEILILRELYDGKQL